MSTPTCNDGERTARDYFESAMAAARDSLALAKEALPEELNEGETDGDI